MTVQTIISLFCQSAMPGIDLKGNVDYDNNSFKPLQVEVGESQTSPNLPREGQTGDSQETEELLDGYCSEGELSDHNSTFNINLSLMDTFSI